MPAISADKIRVPIPLVLGKYELLTHEELYDHVIDCLAEFRRRLENYEN